VPERVRVLSIDGGGIRGLIPALVLAELERRSGRRTAELFDLIAGTSTGGIIACGLTAPGEGSAPALTAEEVVELYESDGPEIFERSVFQRIRSAGGLLDEKYDAAAGLDPVLERHLGETRLAEAVTDIVVPAYETELRLPFFFTSRAARQSAELDFPMRVVARATSSAPTYFEPLKLGNRSLIDGGLFAYNPGMCGFAETLRHSPGAEVVLLSLGTGEMTRPLPFEQIEGWGLVEWAKPILDVVFDGAADSVDFQLRMALGEERYWRLQVELTVANDDLDDASEQNLRALRGHAEELIAARSDDIDAALEALAP
jgi:uncharacterized protein